MHTIPCINAGETKLLRPEFRLNWFKTCRKYSISFYSCEKNSPETKIYKDQNYAFSPGKRFNKWNGKLSYWIPKSIADILTLTRIKLMLR